MIKWVKNFHNDNQWWYYSHILTSFDPNKQGQSCHGRDSVDQIGNQGIDHMWTDSCPSRSIVGCNPRGSLAHSTMRKFSGTCVSGGLEKLISQTSPARIINDNSIKNVNQNRLIYLIKNVTNINSVTNIEILCYLHMKLRTIDDRVVSRTWRNNPGQLSPSRSMGQEPKVRPCGRMRSISPMHLWTNSSKMSLSRNASSCPRLFKYIGHIFPSCMMASWTRIWESKNIPLAWVPRRCTEQPTNLLFNSRAAAVPNILFLNMKYDIN